MVVELLVDYWLLSVQWEMFHAYVKPQPEVQQYIETIQEGGRYG